MTITPVNSVSNEAEIQRLILARYGFYPQPTAVTVPPSFGSTPAFRGETPDTTNLAPLEADITDFSAAQNIKKKEKSKTKKYLTYAGIGFAGLIGTALCFMHRDASKIKKLYKENLVLSNLPEKIEFKEAATLEEAIKFAKETLGIKQVDKSFLEDSLDVTSRLDALNTINRGLVDVSNAHKGKAFLPPAIKFEKMEDDIIAYVLRDVTRSDFGHLNVNRNYFDNAWLNRELDERYGLREFAKKAAEDSSKKAGETEEKERVAEKIQDYMKVQWGDEYRNLLTRYKQSADNLTMMEKRKLRGIYNETEKIYVGVTERYPLKFLKMNKKIFEKTGINYDLEEIAKLSTEEQSKKVLELAKQYKEKTDRILILSSEDYNQSKTIYHELGHLQDYAKNLQELDMKTRGLDIFTKKFWTRSTEEMSNDRHIDELTNRWISAWNENKSEKFLKKNPEKFKKLYPDAYEFLTNKEIQQTAGEVSGYAQSGIGEFIAECYAEMIAGKKLPKNVMDLYKKYNGPMPA